MSEAKVALYTCAICQDKLSESKMTNSKGDPNEYNMFEWFNVCITCVVIQIRTQINLIQWMKRGFIPI